MSRKYTLEIVRSAFEERDYTLLDNEYIDGSKKLTYICNKHADRGPQHIDFYHFLRGQGCAHCRKEKDNPKRISDDEIRRLCDAKEFEFVSSFADSGKTKVRFFCSKHKDKGIQTMSLQSLRRCKGCKYCAGKLRTTEDFIEIMATKNPNIEVLGQYTQTRNRIACKCKIHNYYWEPTANALLRGEGCPVCGHINSNKNSTKSHTQFVYELQRYNKNIIPLEEYKKAKEKIKFRCAICGHEWVATPDSIFTSKYGCPECVKEINTNKQTKTNEVFLQELAAINPHILPLEKYKTNHEKILCRCTIHGYEWYVAPNKILRSPTGCPKCQLYKNEQRIANVLDSLNITYNMQKRFDDCRDKNPLPFDFYLPDYNMCIEYDGEQHFYADNYYNRISNSFDIRKLHDEIKTTYCSQNNIRLLRIPYWENQNIEKILLTNLYQQNLNQQ